MGCHSNALIDGQGPAVALVMLTLDLQGSETGSSAARPGPQLQIEIDGVHIEPMQLPPAQHSLCYVCMLLGPPGS